MRFCYCILFLGAVLGMCGCDKESLDTPRGEGSLELTISAAPESRAEVPGDGVAADGGGMVDLSVTLVDPRGTIVDTKSFTALAGDEQLRKSVAFTGLEIGQYTIYAYANTKNSSALSTQAAASTTRDATFTALTGTATPTIDDTTPMLLTAQKVVPIGVGMTHATIDLLRPVVEFSFELYNHSDYDMQVTALSFSDFNSSTSYVLPHDGEIPTANTYRSLPAATLPQKVTKKSGTDAATGWKELYHTFLFENRAPSYTFSIKIEVPDKIVEDIIEKETTKIVEEEVQVTEVGDPVESPEANVQYVIKQQDVERYVTMDNNNNLSTTTDYPVGNNSAYWLFIPNGSGYRIQNVATDRYLRYNSGLTTTDRQNQATTFTYSDGRLYCSVQDGRNTRTYYLRYNNGLTTTTSQNNATLWDICPDKTTTQTVEREETVITTETITKPLSIEITGRQILIVDRETAAVSEMKEQLRNQQVRVVVNAYYNDGGGTFEFYAMPWEEGHDNEVIFGKQNASTN